MRRIVGMLAGLLLGAAAVFGAEGAEASSAVLRLLNSRASGSPRAYAEAAEEVAAQAKQGRAVIYKS